MFTTNKEDMKNYLGLSDKKMKKLVKKVGALTDLEQLLSVEIKGQSPILHTFYKANGIVIEPNEMDKYDPSIIKNETVILNEKSTKLADSEDEFHELLEIHLTKNKVDSDDISKRLTTIKYLIKDVIKSKKEYLRTINKSKFDRDIELINVSERFVDFLNKFLDPTSVNKKVVNIDKEPFYVQIGALFAQDFISKKGLDYHFKSLKFDSCSSLSRHIQSEVLQTSNSIRQYINDTLNSTGQKNILGSKRMMKMTMDYCHYKNITVSNNFKQIFENINMH